MRCAEVARLVDRYVDGRLEAGAAAGVERHAAGCDACRALVAEARALARFVAAEAEAARAPRGFADRVMDRVLRETLWKPTAAREASRGYRRLGLSVMLGAAVLVAGIVLPRAVGVGTAGAGPALVERVLAGADGVVQGALEAAGGPAARIMEGGTR